MEGGRSARFGRYSRRDLLDLVRNQEPHFRQWRRERNPQSRRFSSARKGATDPSSVALERAAPGGAVRRASTRVPRAARRESNGGADVGRDAAAMWGGRDVRGRARRSGWTPRAVCLALTLLLAFVPATDGARFVGKVHEPVAWKFLAKCVRVAVAPRASLPEPKAPAVARPRRRASGRLAQKDVATRRVERARWLTHPPRPPDPHAPPPLRRRFCFLPADNGFVKEVHGMVQTKIKFKVRDPRPRRPRPRRRHARDGRLGSVFSFFTDREAKLRGGRRWTNRLSSHDLSSHARAVRHRRKVSLSAVVFR